jgi:hypothetical protein
MFQTLEIKVVTELILVNFSISMLGHWLTGLGKGDLARVLRSCLLQTYDLPVSTSGYD